MPKKPRVPKSDAAAAEEQPLRQLIGTRLAAAIEAVGGRKPAATLVGRSPSAISQWSHAQNLPDVLSLRRLALASGFSGDHLLALDANEVLRPADERLVEHGNRLAALEDGHQDHEERIEALEAHLARNALEPAPRSDRNPSATRRTG
jgi:transcriptional regulator with XRE-family HTH domain